MSERVAAWRTPSGPIRVGISSCLLGQEVRFDGGHRKDSYVTGVLIQHFTFVPVCPEMEMGLGTPRETLRLIGNPKGPRLVTTKTGRDLTASMNDYARARVEALSRLGLDGYILKRASPSCGMERVKVYTEDGMPSAAGTGLFASALMGALPLLPVEEEGRLTDPRLRDNFITRVFANHRLRALGASGASVADIVDFHTAHTCLLLAHSPPQYRKLGRLVAGLERLPAAERLPRYAEGVMGTLRVKASTKKHVDVLQHIVGFFKNGLEAPEKRELREVIGDYGRGLVPLIVPMTVVNHYARKLDVAHIRNQIYLHPHPKELLLRNHT